MDKMKAPNILIAVPHNSGTTFLSGLLGNYFKPDVPYFHAADGYDGSDHVLSMQRLTEIRARELSYIAPMHTRSSPYVEAMIKEYNIKTITMTRNIYDCIVSLKDRIRRYKHKTKASSALVFTQTLPIHAEMSEVQLEAYLIKYAVPWYFSFYASWQRSQISLLNITYEALVGNTAETLQLVIEKLGYKPVRDKINIAINETKKMNTRLNVGKIGRGKDLSIAYRKEIAELMSMYPGIDFSPFLNDGSF